MTVVFDAEPLLAFAFDEPGADVVERRLEAVYDGESEGYVTSVNLAEFRYVAARTASQAAADAHIDSLRQAGLRVFDVDGLWRAVAAIKQSHTVALGDAYALAAADHLADDGDTTLLVGADDDYDALAETRYGGYLERFRDVPA